MRMLGKLAVKCEYGCCRVYGFSKKCRKEETRMLKRRERQQWKKEVGK